MKTNFDKLKSYVLKNIELAGSRMHESQKSNMRAAYSKIKIVKNENDIFSILEEQYNLAPYEKSLIKGWPNQKWSLNWIFNETGAFLIGVENGYFAGYPSSEDSSPEEDEKDIERALCYH
jgi:hypothetical protein